MGAAGSSSGGFLDHLEFRRLIEHILNRLCVVLFYNHYLVPLEIARLAINTCGHIDYFILVKVLLH